MSYMHINNTYKAPDILLFKECYASEKIHGSSANLRYNKKANPILDYFSGGESHENFLKLFNHEELLAKMEAIGAETLIVYGEVYGGKCQGMKDTYGPNMRFIAFEVQIDGCWLNVENADNVVKKLGLEFVHYKKIPATIESLNAERDMPSEQAFRNGCAVREDEKTWKKREGIVIRPLIELVKNNGERIISKHKREDFQERKTMQEIDPDKLKILNNAEAIANEWVTKMRLEHVLDKFPKDVNMESTQKVIAAMIEDVEREARGEIIESKEARKAIGNRTVKLFKEVIKNRLEQNV